jgi:hypothetical protein
MLHPCTFTHVWCRLKSGNLSKCTALMRNTFGPLPNNQAYSSVPVLADAVIRAWNFNAPAMFLESGTFAFCLRFCDPSSWFWGL